MCLVLISSNTVAFAAVLGFETQYEYDSSNPAWLTDLVIKEDMATVGGLAARTELTPVPDYPYTETAESFAEDVGYYCSLYSLDESVLRSSSLYFFSVLASQAGSLAGDMSDGDIRTYLESIGIVYPETVSGEELIVARALYLAMATGAFSSFTNGASLEEVLTDYLIGVSGLNREELEKWIPEGSILSFDSYFKAAARLALWVNGYDVSPDTDEETVSALVAHLTLDKMGISADSTLTFEELKYKYMAAMLGVKYGVRVDAAKLASALGDGSEALYILRLIAVNNGIALKDENLEEAFLAVAENTGAFDIEKDEFYADITDYECQLEYRRSVIWIYPTAYLTGNDSYLINVLVDGVPVRNNYYSEISLDDTLSEQTLTVTVSVSGPGGDYSFEYRIKVKQGSEVYVQPENPGESDNPFLSSDSVVKDILSAFGLDTYFPQLAGDSRFAAVTSVVLNTINFIAPTFDSSLLAGVPGGVSFGGDIAEDIKFINVLDEMGVLSDAVIKGIGGMTLDGDFSTITSLGEFITFN